MSSIEIIPRSYQGGLMMRAIVLGLLVGVAVVLAISMLLAMRPV